MKVESNQLLKNTKTGYTDNYEFWVELAKVAIDKFDHRTPESYVLAQIWLGELVKVNKV